DALACAVGSRRRRGASGRPFDRLYGEVVAGHQRATEQRRKRCRRTALLTPANGPTLALRSAVFSPEARPP
ncbi:hypothetical protein, partial [uncultured Tateyamaria sp.]|uniref:hypothetical protein n=1 Tax=uncultured Tateyamaria sp. TaxID=455651 RepID=UPI002614F6C2